MSGAASRRGPVGVAVIGAGNISKQYLDNLTVFPDVKVHVIADLFEDAAAARAKEYGIAESGGVDAALARVHPTTRTLVLGIDSDILFPTHLQKETAERLCVQGRLAWYHELTSPWGHDAFLIEYNQLTTAITAFLEGGSAAQG